MDVPPNEPQSVLDARTMYRSCMDTEAIEKRGTGPILEVIETFGGWPMINLQWTTQDYDILSVVGELSKLGVGVFISSQVVPSFEDSTKHVMMVSEPKHFRHVSRLLGGGP